MHSVLGIARLTWTRLWRGRTVWVTGILLLVPVALGAMAAQGVRWSEERWLRVGEITLRSLVLLAPVLHLSPAIGEELDGKTYTYLWSRPVPRVAVVLGKLLAITPLLMVVACAGVTAAWGLCATGSSGAHVEWLVNALGAAAAGVVGASAFAVGIGALVPRRALVVALGWFFFGEQILPQVTSIQNVSVLYHVLRMAQLPHSDVPGPDGALPALAVLTAIWLTIALWRVRRLEFGAAEG